MSFEVGERVIVYDSKIWNRYGKDIGYNEHCLQVAIIENIRYNVPSVSHDYIYPVLYDVRFMYDGRLSKGHLHIFKINKGQFGKHLRAFINR